MLTLPAETYIAEQLDVVDPQRIHAVREAMREQLAQALFDDWQWAFETHRENGAYRPDPVSSGRRALAGLALTHLCLAARRSGDTVWPGKAYQRFKDAGNMTDRFNALAALVTSGHELAAGALQRFHALFKDEALVLDKWFALQAGAPDRGGNVLPAVKQLMNHPDFSIRNPNRARSVIFSYCSANPGAFHRPDAAGYVFWSERVHRARRHQSAGRGAPGACAGPLEEAGGAAAQRGARSHRPRGGQARPEQRRARGRHARAGGLKPARTHPGKQRWPARRTPSTRNRAVSPPSSTHRPAA